jgi:sRNA-binding protein
MEEAKHKQNAVHLIHLFLGAHYPHLFAKDVYTPLAIGISKSILELHNEELMALCGVSKEQLKHKLSKAIASRNSRRAYLNNLLTEGAVRINLDGEVTELVSDEHKKIASIRLAQKDKRKAKSNN